MKNPSVCLTMVFVLLLINLSPIVESQTPAPIPDIDLDCQVSASIEVWPGSTGGGYFFCIVTNNTAYTSEVEIEISSDILAVSGPNSVTVGPGEEVTFQVGLRGEIGMPTGSTTVNVQATVVEMNGLPPISAEKEDSDTLVDILQYGELELLAQESSVSGYAGGSKTIQFEATNTGNGIDTLMGNIWNWDVLAESGFIVTFSPDSKQVEPGETVLFTLDIKFPSREAAQSDEIKEFWEQDKDGEYYIAYFIIVFEVRSEFSCRYMGACYYESASVTIEAQDSVDSGGVLGMSSTTTYLLGGGTVSLGIFLVALFYIKRKPKQNFTEQISNDNSDYIESTQEEDEIEDEFDFL